MNTRYGRLQPAGGGQPLNALEAVGGAIAAEYKSQSHFFDECAARFGEEYKKLHSRHGGVVAHDLVLSHMIELWGVRTVGPEKVAPILRLFAQLSDAQIMDKYV